MLKQSNCVKFSCKFYIQHYNVKHSKAKNLGT